MLAWNALNKKRPLLGAAKLIKSMFKKHFYTAGIEWGTWENRMSREENV